MQANGLARRADEAGSATSTAAVLNGTRVDGYITDPLDMTLVGQPRLRRAVRRDGHTRPNTPDLDIRLDVLDAAGDVVETSDPQSGGTGDIATGMSAVLRDQIRPGQFYLRVDGVGNGDPLGSGYSDYGSLGAYTLPCRTGVRPSHRAHPPSLKPSPSSRTTVPGPRP